ncbi:hypothetical protein PG993_011264 [Apiospora rasikravindrae]|uniref:CFEM domain-containing protein n=1 Tax=Apiospora rasikravindrae TaxID=990691 RepID=A0ABR1SDV4_9PEZI
MKYAFTAVALIAAVSAQDMSGIPSCAVPCIQSAAATTSCSATDYKCICNDVDAIQGAASSCVMEKCGATVAVSQVLPAVKDFCAKVAAAPAPAPAAPAPEAPVPAAPSMGEAEHPAPAKTDDCTDKTMAPTPTPMSSEAAVAASTSECTTTEPTPCASGPHHPAHRGLLRPPPRP